MSIYMGIVFRQSIKSSIVIFFGAFLGAISNLAYPYVLSQNQLGFFTNIIYWSVLLQVFMLFGSGAILSIFIQKYPDNDERRKVLITGSMLVTLASNILLTIGYIFSKEYIVKQYQINDQSIVREYFYWTVPLIMLMSFGTLFECYLMSQTKTAISAFSKEVLVRIANLGLLGLLALNILSFKTFIISSIFVYVLPATILMYVSSKTKGFGFSLNWKLFNKEEYYEIVKFGWYHVLIGVSLNVMGYLDTLMLATLDERGIESVAIYRIAVFIITVANIPYRAMATSSYSSLNRAYIENDYAHLKDLYSRTSTNILIITAGVFLLIISNINNIVAILPPDYALVKPIVLILAIGRILDTSTGVNGEVINFTKYYKFNFRVSILLIVVFYCLNRLLIPVWGIYGASWSATLTLVLFNIAKTAFLWSKMGLHPFIRENMLLLFGAVFIGFIGYNIPSVSIESMPKLANIIFDLVVRSTITGAIYFLFLLWLKPSKDLHHYLGSIKTNKKLF